MSLIDEREHARPDRDPNAPGALLPGLLDHASLLQLFEDSPEGFAVVDVADGRYLHINAAGRRMLGSGSDPMAGRPAPWEPSEVASDALYLTVQGTEFRYRVDRISSGGRLLDVVRFRDVTDSVRRERQLRAFGAAAAATAFATTLSTALDGLAEQVRVTATMSSCTFLLYDPRGRLLQSGAAGRYPRIPGYIERLAECKALGAPLVANEVVRERRLKVVPHWRTQTLADARFAPIHDFTARADWDTIVVVPLIVRGDVVGVFNGFYLDGDDPAPDDLPFLLGIADQAAVAVENFTMRAQAEQQAKKDERLRLARDLHDSVSQMLFSLNLQASALEMRASDAEPALRDGLVEIRDLTADAFASMRQLILGMRPVEFDGDFLPALRRQIDAVSGLDRAVQLRTPDSLPPLRPEVEEQLLRLVQEAVNNVVKHAAGAALEITVSVADDQLVVEVRDDGPGFDSRSTPAGHFGLEGMRERMAAIGGEFAIDSGSGGTTVRGRVGLDPTGAP